MAFADGKLCIRLGKQSCDFDFNGWAQRVQLDVALKLLNFCIIDHRNAPKVSNFHIPNRRCIRNIFAWSHFPKRFQKIDTIPIGINGQPPAAVEAQIGFCVQQ